MAHDNYVDFEDDSPEFPSDSQLQDWNEANDHNDLDDDYDLDYDLDVYYDGLDDDYGDVSEEQEWHDFDPDC
jgi:hypothetical protein